MSATGTGSGGFHSLSSKGSISVFRDGLPAASFNDQDTRNAILAQLGSLESCPNYWVPIDAIRSNDVRTPAERIVSELYHRCVLPHLVSSASPEQAVTEDVIVGAEYWTQVYTKGRGLAFHVDKDEHAMKTRGEMINPKYSSVLYLTGGEHRGNDGRLRVQSPTVITDEHYDHERRRMVPIDFPTESCMVFPKANRYLVFDGRAGHGVLDLRQSDDAHDRADDDVRMTFLVNWWTTRPEGIERDIRDGLRAEDAWHADFGSNESGENDSTRAPGTKAKGNAENTDKDPLCQPVARREPVFSLSITKEYLFANEPFMMDDFLREQGILQDDNSVSPVILRHRGVVMVPFSPAGDDSGDQVNENAMDRIVDCALISQENHSAYL